MRSAISRMTISQLKAFVSIANLGSFRAAAEHLRLTQPTITLRIQTLESQLGKPLFIRAGNRTRLTEHGLTLLDYAKRILSLEEEASLRIADQTPAEHSLRIGAVDSFALTCMPEILVKLTEQKPDRGVDITVGHTVLLEQKLLDHQLDVAILGDPIPNEEIADAQLVKMGMGWLASPKLGIHKRMLTPDDLARFQLLTLPADTRLYYMMEKWFESGGTHRPRRVCTCSSVATIVALLDSGCGVGLLPKFCVHEKLKRGSLKVIRVRPSVPHGVYTVAQNSQSPCADFANIFRTIQSVAKKKITT